MVNLYKTKAYSYDERFSNEIHGADVLSNFGLYQQMTYWMTLDRFSGHAYYIESSPSVKHPLKGVLNH